MRATKISQLVVIAAILAAIGFALSQILMGQTARSLPVPAMAAGALWILGGGMGPNRGIGFVREPYRGGNWRFLCRGITCLNRGYRYSCGLECEYQWFSRRLGRGPLGHCLTVVRKFMCSNRPGRSRGIVTKVLCTYERFPS
jgi:hypothetical protein